MSGCLLPQNLSCWSLKPMEYYGENTLTSLGNTREKNGQKALRMTWFHDAYRQELFLPLFLLFPKHSKMDSGNGCELPLKSCMPDLFDILATSEKYSYIPFRQRWLIFSLPPNKPNSFWWWLSFILEVMIKLPIVTTV